MKRRSWAKVAGGDPPLPSEALLLSFFGCTSFKKWLFGDTHCGGEIQLKQIVSALLLSSPLWAHLCLRSIMVLLTPCKPLRWMGFLDNILTIPCHTIFTNFALVLYRWNYLSQIEVGDLCLYSERVQAHCVGDALSQSSVHRTWSPFVERIFKFKDFSTFSSLSHFTRGFKEPNQDFVIDIDPLP